MAAEDFHDQYNAAMQSAAQLVSDLDINDPGTNVLDPKVSSMELTGFLAQIMAESIGKMADFQRVVTPLAEYTDVDSLLTDQPGDKVSVQQQQAHFKEIANKTHLGVRMIQQRIKEKNARAKGSYFDPSREPICTIPPEISTGTTTSISDTAMKLLTYFKGDTPQEGEALKTFLIAIYDVSVTNTLTEKCTKAVLKRKLQNTARRLINSYEQEFIDQPERPTLKEIILKLEDRYLADHQPEVAQAKLSMYTKLPNQTFQHMEGEISELATLAARGEDIKDKRQWIDQKKVAVFKQAISDEERAYIQRENQSRSITGLSEMTLSQMVDFLIKIFSEKNAFSTASHLKNTPRTTTDADSINLIQEGKKSKKQIKKEQKQAEAAKKAEEEQKEKDQVYAMYLQNRGSFRGKNRGGRGRGGNRGRGSFYKNNSQQGGKPMPNKPKKFVTAEMVNVSPNCCLKCDSPTHRFQDQDKCVYGKSNLMTGPCKNCKKGGHHYNVCIKDQDPRTVGAPPPSGGKLDPQFSQYPDMTRTIMENQGAIPKNPKNEWIPSLFN